MTFQTDERWLAVATGVAQDAVCSRRQVGAVLIDDEGLIGYGANRSRDPLLSCLKGDCPRGTKTLTEVPSYEQGNHDFATGDNACIARHAEKEALRGEGHTLYVTCEPCRDCWALIKAHDTVRRVVWPSGEWVR